MMAHVSFEAPYNWCDSNCRRCSQHKVCKVAVSNERRRWRREARGEDPDALPGVMEHVGAALHEAQALLQKAANDRRVDAGAPMPSPQTMLSVERLKRASLQLSRCVFALEIAGDLDRERAAECLKLCLQLSGKTARVTSYLAFQLDEVWASDAVPNLLLIELTLTRLRRVLEPLGDPRTSRTLELLQRLLSPLLATVDDAARAHLMELVRSGRAPSPFLVAGGCGDAR